MADGDEQDASARRTTSSIQPGPRESSTPRQQRTEKVGALFDPLGYQNVFYKQKQVAANWSVHPSLPYQANTARFNQATEPSTAAYMGHTGLGALNRSIEHVPRQQFDNVHCNNATPWNGSLTPAQISGRHVISKDLPIFTGKPEEWLIFISNYEQSTERYRFSNEENLIRLQKCLRGQALDAVRGKLMIPATVPYAIGTLRMLYGRSEIVHAALQQKLREEPAIKSDNLNTVIRLALAVQNYCATIAAIGMHEYLYDPALLNELVAKMPSNMKLDWGRHRMSNAGSSLATFDNWLFNVAMCATMVTPYETPPAGNEKKSSTKTTRERIFVHNTVDSPEGSQQQRSQQEQETISCAKCAGNHRLSNCDDFRSMGTNQRWELVKKKRLCFCCFLRHRAQQCKSKKKCHVDGCESTHHVLLHTPTTSGSKVEHTGQGSNHRIKAKDERSMQIMEATTTYLEDEKRWQTGLLWRFNRMHLSDSYQMAVKRLKCLEANMSKDPPLKEFMMSTMHDYKQKGYISRLKDITNPNKKKTRLVWDAAAKVSGMSLNDCLLKGPDTLASLMGVLIRFRERPIAESDDIREMFHQVKVRHEDQPAQKFLWRDGDSSRFPETYVMQVMMFGASCSPALANYVKNRNAERFVAEHPDAVKAICENTSVDDWLQSALEDDCEELDKRISAQDEAQEKVLGLWWLPGQDLLTFVVTPNLLAKASKERPTKRRVLSVIMSISDPLGLLGFFNIRAKIILQNIWRSNIGWDDDLTNEDEADWQHWLDLLSNLNAVRIPRCMKWVSRAQAVQMHTFVDASMNAYAAVVFLRAELDGQVHCSLVASKTRVAPLKPVFIPRMELMAAVLGLRLAKCIQKEMSVRIHTRTFWTDSKDVLYWIRSDAWNIHGSTRWFIGPPFLYLEESQWP
ncbi:uncharacterized protein [Drosophila virilis]|uniref:uncharacterized protein n=1 Tax=Drosophila virilis TaxID=7244 RepID=UPI0038B30BCD